MNRRFGAAAIVLMALTALAGVLSFVFWPKKNPKNFTAQKVPVAVNVSSTSLSTSTPSSETTSSKSAQSNPLANSLPLVTAVPRPDQPENLKPQPPSRNPDWKLLDWSIKPIPEKPEVQLRASCYLASGKYSFVRLEQEIQLLPNGEVKVLKNTEMVGDQIIVKLPQGSPATDIQTLAAKIGGQAAAKPFTTDTWLVTLPQKLEAVPEALAASMHSGIPIDYAEPNHLVRPLRTPNDPNFTNNTQWSLYNNTQLNIDIHAPQAWDRRFNGFYTTNGSTNTVVVAVIDTGVRYTHEDLAANMWKNPGETGTDSFGRNKETNGVDDDGNGYIDDVHGIDTYDNDSDPMPGAAHGTHCAGLIAAVGNNGKGITGVAWSGVQIMALKMFGPNGESPTAISDITACVNYAANKGAKVINASYGSTSANNTEAGSIYQAGQAGVIMVAAAGNGGSDLIGDNNDSTPFYPACYTTYNSPKLVQITNIVAVGSTDRNDNRSTFSNYGTNSVDLFAPGENMYSTESASDSNYNSGSGTSFAAPLVTGAVALLAAEFPGDSVGQRMARITGTNAVDVVPGLNGYCKTGGRLNLAKLLPAADPSTLPLALAWHRPDYTEPLLGSAMRTPTNAAFSNTLTVFSGVKKFNNTNGFNTSGLVNQTGGWLFYRTSSSVGWSSNTLAWHSNTNDYQLWKGTISNVVAQTYQYYLQLDFDSGARTTYSYYTNNTDGFATTTNPITAQASPYTLTVAKAAATITFSNLSQTYNGSARSVTTSTTPSGLATTITYNGSSSAPTNAGTYTVVATVNDANYQGSATNTLAVTKATATVSLSGLSQTYDGTARTVSASTTPTGLTTSITYNGSPSAPTNAGTYTVVATVNDANYQGSATNTLAVTKATATVSLSGLSQTYDGTARMVSASTTPSGLTASITYNGSPSAPINAGSYPVVAAINDVNYQGSATNTLTVAKAVATISLSDLNQTYDGTTRAVSASTTPTGLATSITYNGSSSAPTNAGSYPIVATINDINYQGSATNTLTVAKATATVTLSGLTQTYDGSPKSVTVTTAPSGLATSITYNGSATAPTAAGSYAVAVSISDPNYQGSASATLSIQQPSISFSSTFGSSTPTSDADGDGVPALVEYALGGGTNGNDQNILPVPSVSGSNISMAAVVRTNDTNLLIYPQASLDFSTSNWVSSGFTTNVSNQTNVPAGFQRREYQFNAGTNRRAFLKLTIEQK